MVRCDKCGKEFIQTGFAKHNPCGKAIGIDKFYTLPTCSKKCIDKTCDMFDITKWDLIVEPSAGNGSFLNQIPSDNKIGIDILP